MPHESGQRVYGYDLYGAPLYEGDRVVNGIRVPTPERESGVDQTYRRPAAQEPLEANVPPASGAVAPSPVRNPYDRTRQPAGGTRTPYVSREPGTYHLNRGGGTSPTSGERSVYDEDQYGLRTAPIITVRGPADPPGPPSRLNVRPRPDESGLTPEQGYLLYDPSKPADAVNQALSELGVDLPTAVRTGNTALRSIQQSAQALVDSYMLDAMLTGQSHTPERLRQFLMTSLSGGRLPQATLSRAAGQIQDPETVDRMEQVLANPATSGNNWFTAFVQRYLYPSSTEKLMQDITQFSAPFLPDRGSAIYQSRVQSDIERAAREQASLATPRSPWIRYLTTPR